MVEEAIVVEGDVESVALIDTNLLIERYRFHQRCQQSDESLQAFINDVLELAKTCDFGEHWTTFVRDRVVFGLLDEDLKWNILKAGGDPSLHDIMNAYDLHEFNSNMIIDETLYETVAPYETGGFLMSEMGVVDQNSLIPEVIYANDEVDSLPLPLPHPPPLPPPPLKPLRRPRMKNTRRKSNANNTAAVNGKPPLEYTIVERVVRPPSPPKQQQLPSRRKVVTLQDKINKGYLECPECHDMVRPSQFNRHMENHLPLRIDLFACYNCNTAMPSVQHLLAHFDAEHAVVDVDTDETLYPCARCDLSLDSAQNLRTHLYGHNLGNATSTIIKCRECEELFEDTDEFNAHAQVHCTCDICHVVSKSIFLAKLHRINHFRDEKPFECFVCHYRFEDSDFLKYHMDIHNAKAAYKQ